MIRRWWRRWRVRRDVAAVKAFAQRLTETPAKTVDPALREKVKDVFIAWGRQRRAEQADCEAGHPNGTCIDEHGFHQRCGHCGDVRAKIAPADWLRDLKFAPIDTLERLTLPLTDVDRGGVMFLLADILGTLDAAVAILDDEPANPRAVHVRRVLAELTERVSVFRERFLEGVDE